MAHQHTAGCSHGTPGTLGLFLFALIQSAGAWVRRVRERRQQRRQAWATYDALRGLDDRTLRDIGYHRSELPSVSTKFPGDVS